MKIKILEMKRILSFLAVLAMVHCWNNAAHATASGAAASATIANGAVTAITVSAGGTGYTLAPTVFIMDTGGGTGATSTATVSGGVVTAITVTAGGTGYTSDSTVVILLPNASDLGSAPTETPTDVPTSTPDTGSLPSTPTTSPSSGGIGQVAIDDPDLTQTGSGTRIINISTRGKVGSTDDQALVGGFVVRGTPGTTIRVIVRGLGPYMSNAIDSSLLLADPKLEVRNAQDTVLATNDNWKVQFSATDPDPATLQDSAYAAYTTSFAGVGLQDNEAGVIMDLPVWSESEATTIMGSSAFAGYGIYTAVVTGVNSTTGIAQVAIDDVELSEGGATNGNRIINISTRGYVGTGDYEALVGGFVTRGAPGESKSYIVRGLGPYMKAKGVTLSGIDFIEDPFLELQDYTGTVLNNNDNWQTQYAATDPDPSTTINNGSYTPYTTAFSGIGLQTKEAALLVDLPTLSSGAFAGYGVYTGSVKTGQ